MNGFEVLKEIRSGPQSDLPVIMVSGLNDPRGIAKCLANGANDYLSKPVEPIILDAKVISALERFTYRRELNKIAMTDQLTQVRNRRSLMQAMNRLVQQYEQEEREFAVVLLDIDHFKKVNDTYGHAAGDFVLQQFTQCLKSVTRADDIIGRMGGEEFLLAFQDTSVSDLKNICERLRRAVEDMRLDFEEHTIKITTSGGVYMSVEGMLPVEKMIDLADRRLYSAKTGGRNRIEHRSIGE
jgi:two-component system cell cycle response regulator